MSTYMSTSIHCTAWRSDRGLPKVTRCFDHSMDKSSARSDEQLAYYVAQAREIIDLSIMSQKEVVEELRALTSKPSSLADEVS